MYVTHLDFLILPDHDLHKLVKSKPELLTDDVIKSIIYQVLVALKYLHSAEVIHRDLKVSHNFSDSIFCRPVNTRS